MFQQNIPFKEITTAVAERKKYKRAEFNICISDVDHIFARHLIEFYLRMCGCTKFGWLDDNNKFLPASNLISNALCLFRDVLIWPFQLLRYKMLLNKLEQTAFKKYLPFNKSQVVINYLRTDHWFNLRSGGSVGHVSGVINAMAKAGKLKTIFSSDNLFEVQQTELLEKISPRYNVGSSIPELPQMNYNFQLIEKLKHEERLNGIAIYQRYSQYNVTGVYLKYHFGIPLILEFNGSEVWAIKNWGSGKILHFNFLVRCEKINLMHADLIVVVSQNLKDSLVAEGVEAQKILVNPNGVSLQKFNEQVNGNVIREKYSLQNHKVIGFIGTFGEWHGVVEMAKAIVMFFDAHPDEISKVKFLLIGDGNLLESVRGIVYQSSYRDTVIFTGKVNQNESPQYLAACDILLSPHIGNPDGSKFFGSPTKLFEYMAMRKPIIASNLEQIGDILTHSQSALLVPPGDVAALANAYFHLLKNETLQQTLAQGAYNKVIENYTWDMHVNKILEAGGGEL